MNSLPSLAFNWSWTKTKENMWNESGGAGVERSIPASHSACYHMKNKPSLSVCLCFKGAGAALNFNKGSELLSCRRVLAEWVLVIMMWRIPLDVVALGVLQLHWMFTLGSARLPVCPSPRYGKQVFDSWWVLLWRDEHPAHLPLMSYMRRILFYPSFDFTTKVSVLTKLFGCWQDMFTPLRLWRDKLPR